MTLEDLLSEIKKDVTVTKPNNKKVMITGDYHIPYLDIKSYRLMKAYAKKYKPDTFIINGDFLDFYTLSRFDRNPTRKESLQDELDQAKIILHDLRKILPKADIIYLEGNHETRLKKYLWKNNELFCLKALNIENLLGLKDLNIKYVETDLDYWKTKTGCYNIGDVLVMHGDSRLNGASYSQNSGYSATNTVKGTMKNTVMNHTHRLAEVHIKDLIGLECGCLCVKPNYNWQNGFVTFEMVRSKCNNFNTYEIKDGILVSDNIRMKA